MVMILKEQGELRKYSLEGAWTPGHLQGLFMNSPIGVYVVQDNQFRYVNLQFQKDTGYAQEELASLVPTSLVVAEDRPAFRANVIEMLRGHRTAPYEFRVLTKSGETRWVLGAMTAIKYQGRRAALGYYMDITGRRGLEQALRESEEMYRALVENGPNAVAVNVGTNRVFVNRAYLELQGLSDPSQVVGKPLDEFVVPEDRDMVKARTLARQRGDPAPSVYDYRIRRANGEVRTVQTCARATTYKGAPASLAIIRDMTDRRQTEKALRESEAIQRRLAQESEVLARIGRIIVSSVNPEAVFEEFASEVSRLLAFDRLVVLSVGDDGSSRGWVYEATGPNPIVRPSKTIDVSESILGEVMRTRKGVIVQGKTFDEMEARYACLGRLRELGIQSSIEVPLITRNEVVGGMTIRSFIAEAYTDRDMTVAERIAQQIAGAIANEQLYTDLKKAKHVLEEQKAALARSNAELEQFAYVASHDLQEPLRMVSSYVQLLARRYQGKLDSEADEFIAYAVDGANRMQTLLNHLLKYSRVGTQGKPFETVSAVTALQYALDNLKVAIDESGAQVTWDQLPTVLADDTQLVQLLQNLVGNSIKFRGPEPPRVHIAAVDRGMEWEFTVQDNGIGMAPEHLDRIFLIFQRLHTKTEYPGSGIGLAICKKIVERHGGRIWVTSQPGKGATFHFTIPVRAQQQGETQ